MKIRELQLFTTDLEITKSFYTTILAFDLIEENENKFSLQVGWTKLTFVRSEEKHIYHFSFLIDKTQFENAFNQMKNKIEILDTEPNNKIALFENWNAKSFYFYDGNGNLAEIITHVDFKFNNHESPIKSPILGISEIGLPTTNIKKVNQILEEKTTSKFWKGDFERFGTNGSDEGKILLPNYLIKETWFPTDIKIIPTPFVAILENNEQCTKVIFDNNKLNISNITSI